MKKIEAKLEAFETGCYTAFFDAIDEMIFIKDHELRYVFANEALLNFFGRDTATFLGKKDSDFMDIDHAKSCENSDLMALKEQRTVMHYETIGDRIYQTRKFPFYFKEGQKGLGGIIFDVTLQHKTLESLKLEKERIEVILEASDIGLWDWDIVNDIVLWDAKCFEMLGYAPDAFALHYKTWVELMHHDTATIAQEEVRRQLEVGETFEIQFQLRKNDGSYAWIEGRGRVVEHTEDGSPKRMVGIHINKTEEKQSKEALVCSEQKFKQYIESAPYAVFVMDRLGYYHDVNRMAEYLSGYNKEELLNMSIADLVPKKDLVRVRKHFKQLEKDGITKSTQMQYRPKRGELRYWSVTPVKLSHEEFLAFAYDITEQKKASDALVESNHSLEKANIAAKAFAEQAQIASLAKSNFLANMSHEIRTPMNAIIGLSELLSDTDLSPKQSEYLQKITNSSTLLLGIINDILDFSKIEAGKIEIENTPISLKNVITHLYTMFEESALKKNIYFDLNIHDTVPSVVLVDELKLIQILNNFLSNAFKFTTQGKVILNVMPLNKSDNKVTLRFSIDDTGIGMNEVQLKKLFIPFNQADVSITQKYGGTGLGLSIAKRLAEAMGGKVGVFSHEKEGSSFFLDLEVEVLDWEQTLVNKESLAEECKKSLEGLRILVVEDNSINQEVAKAMLERIGINVKVANNGKEGVEYFLEQHFDAILMDIQMPVMSGYEASMHIRKHDKNIPIIALTAAATAEDKKKALNAGMNEHLTKPLHSKRLYDLLESLCNRSNNISIISKSKILASSPSVKSMQAIDPKHVDVMFDGDISLFYKLLIHFLGQLNEEFGSIVHFVRDNHRDAPMLIHSLKGVSGNLGAFTLANVCTRIDTCYKRKQNITMTLVTELEESIRKLKEELSYLRREDIGVIEDEDIYKALLDFRLRLEEADLIEPFEQASLVKSLDGKINKEILAEWNKALERLDYEEALRLMKTWNIFLLKGK